MIRELSAAGTKEKWDRRNWHAVDLDSTIALHGKWRGDLHIGPPVPKMLARVKAWLRQGQQVKIFTARVDDLIPYEGNRGELRDLKEYKRDAEIREAIEAWCLNWVGQVLEITNRKDRWTVDIWDDRARQVEPNKGTLRASEFLARSFNRLHPSE